MAIDRNELNDLVGAGLPQIANGVFSPGQEGYLEDNGFSTAQNLEAAKQLIDDYKQSTGADVVAGRAGRHRRADHRAGQRSDQGLLVQQIGVDTKLDTRPAGPVHHQRAVRRAAFTIYQWRSHAARSSTSRTCGGTAPSSAPDGQIALNFGRLNDPQVDADLATARSESGPGQAQGGGRGHQPHVRQAVLPDPAVVDDLGDGVEARRQGHRPRRRRPTVRRSSSRARRTRRHHADGGAVGGQVVQLMTRGGGARPSRHRPSSCVTHPASVDRRCAQRCRCLELARNVAKVPDTAVIGVTTLIALCATTEAAGETPRIPRGKLTDANQASKWARERAVGSSRQRSASALIAAACSKKDDNSSDTQAPADDGRRRGHHGCGRHDDRPAVALRPLPAAARRPRPPAAPPPRPRRRPRRPDRRRSRSPAARSSCPARPRWPTRGPRRRCSATRTASSGPARSTTRSSRWAPTTRCTACSPRASRRTATTPSGPCKLRQGINFTDGTPFNADAAIRNLQDTGTGLLIAGALVDVAKNPDKSLKIEKVDDSTFTIYTGKGGDPNQPLSWPELRQSTSPASRA